MNIKFNVFYSTFTDFFYIFVTFLPFTIFKVFLNFKFNVFYICGSQVPQVLRLMHQRCQVVYISDDSDALLSSLVVVDCAWFMRTIVSATSEAARSQGAVVDANKLVRCLFTDNYADVSVQMGKLSSAHSLVVHWLLAAFQSLQVSKV